MPRDEDLPLSGGRCPTCQQHIPGTHKERTVLRAFRFPKSTDRLLNKRAQELGVSKTQIVGTAVEYFVRHTRQLRGILENINLEV